MKNILLIVFAVLILSPTLFSQDPDSTVSSVADTSTMKPIMLQDEPEFLIEEVPQPKCGLPNIGFSTDGWFWDSKEVYDQFHSLVPNGFKNDQQPVFCYEDNNWSRDSNDVIDVRLGEARLVKVEDEYFYVHKSPRNLFHSSREFEFNTLVQPGLYMAAMANKEKVKTSVPVVRNSDGTGFNFKMRGIKLSKEIKEIFQKAFEE